MSFHFKRISVFVFALLFAFSLHSDCFIASASGVSSYSTNNNLWHWLSGGVNTNSSWQRFTNAVGFSAFLGYIQSTNVCPVSSDNKHHASSVTGVSDDGYCICVCEECGNEFTSSTLADDVYNDYTASLPAQELKSDGSLIWSPTVDDFISIDFTLYNGKTGSSEYKSFSFSLGSNIAYENILKISATDDVRRLRIFSNQGTNTAKFLYINKFNLDIPVSGVYTLLPGPCFSAVFVDSLRNIQTPYSSDWRSGADMSCYVSPLVYSMGNFMVAYWSTNDYVDSTLLLPSFSIVPSTAFNVTSSSDDDTYNIGTRAASIYGDYGIVTQSGDIQKIDTQTIVNETNNTYYSPSTGEPQSFTDWTYDYSDRSYTVTTTEGDTTTITYGDEYVTINEGDTVTNIYYITEVSDSGNGGGSGDSGGGNTSPDTPHYHSYTSSITTTPSCTLSGVRTYTCTCGNTYTENIPATGHSWAIKQQVPTEYDENGDLLTQGYTIYKCSVCGEELREDNTSGLSPSSPNISSQTTGVFSGIFGIFLDFITFMFSLFNGFIKGGISAFFQAITDGTSEFFGLLNPVNWF